MCVGDPVPRCIIVGIFFDLFFERSERLDGRSAQTILPNRENKRKQYYEKLRVIHGCAGRERIWDETSVEARNFLQNDSSSQRVTDASKNLLGGHDFAKPIHEA